MASRARNEGSRLKGEELAMKQQLLLLLLLHQQQQQQCQMGMQHAAALLLALRSVLRYGGCWCQLICC